MVNFNRSLPPPSSKISSCMQTSFEFHSAQCAQCHIPCRPHLFDSTLGGGGGGGGGAKRREKMRKMCKPVLDSDWLHRRVVLAPESPGRNCMIFRSTFGKIALVSFQKHNETTLTSFGLFHHIFENYLGCLFQIAQKNIVLQYIVIEFALNK